jgi:glyoxylase-like metal-dependent hydrolase (beta-lactamase superfamily II)
MKPAEVAEGVYRLGTKWANFYLVAGDDEFTVVDSGYPRYFAQLSAVLGALDRPLDAIRGVIVTHHHVDHAGTAEEVRATTGATVFVHPADAPIVRGDRPSHPPQGFYRQSWRPSMMRYLGHSAVAGGARYRPVSAVEALSEDKILDLPGRPRVIPTPGHTAGHCSVVLEERGVLFSGDAMVNFDYASGADGLNQHRFNEDRARALASLERLDGVDAELVLFGHGDPWREGSRQALRIVRDRASP